MPEREPVEALRASPGEFFLAAESVEKGMRFRVRGTLYEVTGEPRKWGISYVAELTVIEGLRPGTVLPRGMLHVGRKVDP